MNKFQLFTKDKEKQILKDFNDIVNAGNKSLKQFPREKFVNATSGMHLHANKDETKEIYTEIMHVHKNKKYPIIHKDSLTAWCNQAVEQYGLEIRDILAMKPGQKMKVILIDRNVGEYISNQKIGKKYNPRKEGFSFATYTHIKGLSGVLNAYDVGVISDCFEWEINGGCNDCFWGPIPKGKTYKDYHKQTKIGWRGPCIELSDTQYLPKYFVHYNTWWDDYPHFRHHNFLVDKVTRLKVAPTKEQKGGYINGNKQVVYKLVY